MNEFIMHPRRCGKTQNIKADDILKMKEYKKPFNRGTGKANLLFNALMIDLSYEQKVLIK